MMRRLLDIMTLEPRVIDLEQASAWLAGDVLKDIPGDIVAILTADEDEVLEP
jgi:hypothetical protein